MNKIVVNLVFDIKFLFSMIKTEFSAVKYYFRCKLLFPTSKPPFKIVFSLENLVSDLKFLFFSIKSEFSTVKYYFRCKVHFSTRKPRFRGKISVFPVKNQFFHCKTAFLMFFSREVRFRGKISVFPDKRPSFPPHNGISKLYSLENLVFDIKFMFFPIKSEFSTVKY